MVVYYEVAVTCLGDAMTFGLEELFLGEGAAGVFGVEFAVGFEGAPVGDFVLAAFFTGVGGDVGEDAGGEGAGEVGLMLFG